MRKRHAAYIAFICMLLSVLTAGGCASSADSVQTDTESTAAESEAEDSAAGAQDTETSSDSDAEEADEDTESFLYYTEGEDSYSATLFAMDTYMTVTAYGDHAQSAVEEAASEIQRLDALLSTGISTSEIAQINADGGGTLSVDTQVLLERALELYESTDGVFDIAIYPIMDAWGFTTQDYTVPDDETLAALLTLTDASQILFDADTGTVSFGIDGMQIDLGGIAKGYTSASIMDIFEANGVESGLVSLGGNVQVLNVKTDGSLWRVAVQSPDDTADYLGILEVQDCAVITSGGYERYFEEDGVTYHHIIDPQTGYPADSGLLSVTIVSEDGTLADALSTSLFIMGAGEAITYWCAHSDEFDMILASEDGVLYVSEGIYDVFECTCDYEIEVVTAEE